MSEGRIFKLDYVGQGRILTDVEIDRRDYNGWTLLLLEDRHRNMMLPNGTSKQYILAVEFIHENGTISLKHKRFISQLITKKGFRDAKEGTRAIFLNPEKFISTVGEHWVIFSSASSQGPRKRKSLKSV